jgi:CDP-4-dehydro-6-deoxyglucose reductase
MTVGIFTTIIEKIISQGAETRHFKLIFEPGVDFQFKAGQFVNIIVPPIGEHKTVKRPYSIASPPSCKGFLDLTWKRVEGGYVTNYLWTLKENDRMQIQGPLGHFTLKHPLPKTIIFVSTGTGIAPFRSMIPEILKNSNGHEVWNIFGNRYEDEILYKDEFEQLAKEHSNFHNIFTISRPKNWKGETHYVQFMVKKYIADPHHKHIYVCGLKNMISEVLKTAIEMGFERNQIFFEKYD